MLKQQECWKKKLKRGLSKERRMAVTKEKVEQKANDFLSKMPSSIFVLPPPFLFPKFLGL